MLLNSELSELSSFRLKSLFLLVTSDPEIYILDIYFAK